MPAERSIQWLTVNRCFGAGNAPEIAVANASLIVPRFNMTTDHGRSAIERSTILRRRSALSQFEYIGRLALAVMSRNSQNVGCFAG
jgi:hypothetical protein